MFGDLFAVASQPQAKQPREHVVCFFGVVTNPQGGNGLVEIIEHGKRVSPHVIHMRLRLRHAFHGREFRQ